MNRVLRSCNMPAWRVIDSGLCIASYNMAVDEAIATAVRKGSSPPTLRLYGWERTSVSLGFFQKITDLDTVFCDKNNIPVVRRPTGGRAILHGDELTYSFSSGNSGTFSRGILDSYRKLSTALKSALETLGLTLSIKSERESRSNLTRSPLCFKSMSYGEISFKGGKLVGSAQKRWKDGFLQQGSIPYATDAELVRRVFKLGSSADPEGCAGLRDIVADLDPDGLKEAIILTFENAFGIRLIPSSLHQEEILLARELESRKYLSREWTAQR